MFLEIYLELLFPLTSLIFEVSVSRMRFFQSYTKLPGNPLPFYHCGEYNRFGSAVTDPVSVHDLLRL